MDDGQFLANQPLVIDNGSQTLRSGIAGASEPGIVFDTCVGRTKHDRVMAGGALDSGPRKDAFVGRALHDHRGLMRLHWAMRHGQVMSWSDMEFVWQHMYEAGGLTSEDHPILLTEPPLNPGSQRLRTAQVFFETFNVPAAFFATPAVLSLYAAGKTTGLALDVGDGVAHCVPVYEGFALDTAVMRSDLAGGDVTDFLQLLLRKQGVKLMTSAEREIVREIKEKHAFVSPNQTDTAPSGTAAAPDMPESRDYRLPDGQKITLETRTLGRAPELLFRPHIWASEERGVHQLVADAVARSDMDLRAVLFQSIVLSGGATHTRGFGDRLLAELKTTVPGSTKLRIFAPPNRASTAWTGGSILAGLSTFKKMWATAAEWEESPERVLLKGI